MFSLPCQLLLDILCELPDECRNEKFEMSLLAEQACQNRVATASSQLLTLLFQYLQSSGQNHELQNRVLRCLYRWARFGGLSMEQVLRHLLSFYFLKFTFFSIIMS